MSMPEAKEKYGQLVSSIASMKRVAVAFSGGADSTLLLKACIDAGADITAFMATGEHFFAEEQRKARELAETLGIKLITFHIDLVNDETFKRNWEDRCLICKSAILRHIKKECQEMEIDHILEGSQLDDLKEVRPGRAALIDMNIRSPLVDAKLNKEDVRALLKEKGLPNWNAPSVTCLATRVPHDVRISSTMLHRVEKAESLLAHLNFRSLRVRDHEYWARIEVAQEDLPRLFAERDKVLALLKPLGYRTVSMDLMGYHH
ncbi:MAG: ATP-dependent sacrificial sulfur transferase LarE [Methanomassiliicoccales archaeon]|nr:ATP-dependent sacrificial sulfur transferase LarE [Methanomassiliicoccales archaeon]